MYKQVLAKESLEKGENHPDTIATMNDLGSLLSTMEWFKEALKWQEGVILRYGSLDTKDEMSSLSAMDNLAHTLSNLDRRSKALAKFQQFVGC